MGAGAGREGAALPGAVQAGGGRAAVLAGGGRTAVLAGDAALDAVKVPTTRPPSHTVDCEGFCCAEICGERELIAPEQVDF